MIDFLHPEAIDDFVVIILTIAGAASILVTALQKTVVPLREWAASTKNDTDNRVVAVYASFIGGTALCLDAVKRIAAVAAVRPADTKAMRPRPGPAKAEDGSVLDETDVRDLAELGLDKPGEPRPKAKTFFKPPPSPGAGVLLLTVMLAACGHARLKDHAIAAEAMAVSLTDAKGIIEDVAHQRESDAVDRAETREEAEEAVARIRARFIPVERMYEATRLAWDAYRGAIIRANAQGRGLDPRAPGELLHAWLELVTVAKALGVALPPPPVALEAATEQAQRAVPQPTPEVPPP